MNYHLYRIDLIAYIFFHYNSSYLFNIESSLSTTAVTHPSLKHRSTSIIVIAMIFPYRQK